MHPVTPDSEKLIKLSRMKRAEARELGLECLDVVLPRVGGGEVPKQWAGLVVRGSAGPCWAHTCTNRPHGGAPRARQGPGEEPVLRGLDRLYSIWGSFSGHVFPGTGNIPPFYGRD